jgi:hypothetical protein
LLADQEETWRLKSRAIWLENGDENTKFFQAYAKGRREENTIWSLKDQEGRSITSFEGLASLGKNHFQTLFKADRRVNIAEIIKVALYLPSFVDEQGNQDLFVEVTEAELKETLLSFQKDKSPGPDGWTIEFYRGFFDLIGADLLKVIEESRTNGRIHSPFNSTFIALIPKVNDPQSFDDFRPISLCNCIYKIIAKIIARRLKPFLSEAISKEQFRFLEGRQIHEAIGVAQEGLHSLKTARTKGEILKIDLSKAYDRVSWAYIRLLLTHLGFEVPFIKWVMACISSVSFAVLINGAASPFFISERGLRQGFPLSPLLFLLVAEGLSKAIDTTTRAGNFQGIQVAPGMRITHLLFVDDVLIFCNGRVGDAEILADILNLFRLATGMQINSQKSTITTSEMDREEAVVYQRLFPFTIQDISEGLKYLGFQLKPNKYRKEDWKWLLTKLEKRLNGWSFRWLSRAGRLTLTKSVLEAIPVYWMSLAWIPKGVLEKIRRTCSQFIWSGSGDKYTQPWAKWESIAMPKALGGWGLKNIFLFSKALAAKVCWRLISVSSLWTQVVTQKYISPDSVEDWIRTPNKSASHCSIIWKAMISSFSVVGDSLAWRVGKGNHLRIGADPWPSCGNSHILPEELIDQLHRQGIFFLSHLVDPHSTNIWNQGWRSVISLGLNGVYADLLRNYILALRRGHIRLTDREDELVWQKDPLGSYTPKSGYIALNIDPIQQNPRWWWKGLWKLKCPQKAKIYMWAALNNRIPTWDNLNRRQIEGPGRCSLCKNANESTFHILISCPFSKKVWTETSSSLRQRCIWTGDTLELAWKNWSRDPRNKEIKALPLLISWGIWLAQECNDI